MRLLLILYILLLCSSSFSFELVMIQGLSKEKQTFVIRNTEIGNKKIFEGKKATFTSDNVSIIAKAVTVTNEFIQWEIMNHFTDVPFERGEIITMHDAKEHLWTLTPELAKKKYFRRLNYKVKRSIEGQIFFSKGLSESTSGTDPQNVDRGGLHFEASFRTELNTSFSLAYGIRYARDVVNLDAVSIINTRLLGIVEGRYYFPPLLDFYDARIGLGLGAGYGQSRSEIIGAVNAGNAVLLPSTKISLMFPIDYMHDFEFVAAFEAIRLDETNASEEEETTNIIQSKVGIVYRRHL